jgi:hypothetical protein
MLSNLLIIERKNFLTHLNVQFLRATASTFWLQVYLRVEKIKKSLNFVHIFILFAVVQHKHKRDLEFMIVIVVEGGSILNLFLAKNCLFQFFIKLLKAVFQKNRLSSVFSSLTTLSPMYRNTISKINIFHRSFMTLLLNCIGNRKVDKW